LFGAFVRAFGSQGSGPGQLQSPAGLSVDSEDRVYVADTGNDRMQQFDAAGTFLSAWGTTGSGKGKFRGPTGVAVNSADDLYVSDAGNHRIQAFGQLPQPDGAIRVGASGAFAGDAVYNTSGRGQAVSASAARGRSVTYETTWQNDGVFPDRIRLKGRPSGANVTVRYVVGGTNVTPQVTAGTFRTVLLAPGDAVTVRITVTMRSSAPAGLRFDATLRAKSQLDPTRKDVVRFVTTRA
ncbi:MAG: hypothetical protein KDB10_20720, partial [Acidimicrobiales bacterium]|nr:hypothetical protein [Acidimicrobiales bacterium]